ncbi:MAG: DoxX family protein [Bacteroidetes bacterium]|nr:DoxX family protein [Bacteroidota bacterium]
MLNLGKWLYAIPFAVFGLFHFMSAKDMAESMNVPGGQVMVYLTGVALIAVVVSIIIGKMDKLATVLLALMLLIFVFALHLPSAAGGNEMAISNILKDVSLAGAALMYAKGFAKDNSVIG